MTNLDGVFRREWGPAVAALARWSVTSRSPKTPFRRPSPSALRAWSRDGGPTTPADGSWRLPATAHVDRLRRESVRPGKEFAAVVDDIRARTDRVDVDTMHDDELRMMFTCAHPALDPNLTAGADTLRLISGLTVAEIARALLQYGSGGRSTDHPRQERDPGTPTSRYECRPPNCSRNARRTCWPASTPSSPRDTGRRAGPSAIRDELCDEGVPARR